MRAGRQFPDDVAHRAERVELRRAGAADLVPESAGRKAWRHCKGSIGPKRGVAAVPDRVGMEQWQAGVEHVVRTVAEVPCHHTTDHVTLRLRTHHTF